MRQISNRWPQSPSMRATHSNARISASVRQWTAFSGNSSRMRCCTSRRRLTSTGRSAIRPHSFTPMSSARISCSKPREDIGKHCRPVAAPGFASFTFRPTRSSARWARRAGSEHLASAWYRTYELPVIICNASNNYGPYQFPEKLIPLAVLNALEGIPLPVYGDGSNVRDWLYVEDFVDGFLKLLDRGRPGESYNFGGGSECSNLNVAKLICGILDRIAPISRSRNSLIAFVPDRPGHDLRYAIDATKAQRELDWRPRVELERGLELTIRWYVENRAWWEPLRRNVYRGERLGLVDVQR